MTEEKKVDAPEVKASDLDLIDDKLADGTKDDAELWNEIAAADKPVAATVAADSGIPFEGENEPDKQEGAPEAAPAVKGSTAPDIWASAPPELKAAFDALSAEKVKIENDHKAVSGRVSAYQRKYEQLAKAATPVKKDGETVSPTKAIESLMEDYPEIAKPLKQALETIEGKLNNLDEAQESLRKDAETELQDLIDEQTALLEEKHPDWLDTLKANGTAFAAWVEDQPRRIREMAYRNADAIVNAAETAEVVSQFKAHLGKPAEPAPRTEPKNPNPPLSDRRERQLAATSSPTKQGGRPVVSGIPEDGDPEQIWKAFDAVDQQKQRARA